MQSAHIKIAGYSLALLLPVLVGGSIAVGLPWLPVIIVFGFLPMLSLAVGEDMTLPSVGLRTSPAALAYLDMLPRAYGIAWLVMLAWAIDCGAAHEQRALSAVGVVLSVGIASAVAVCTAHELLHRRSAFDRCLARTMTSLCLYGHMGVEHLHHHASVGTPDYGATAPRGMCVYRFAISDFLRAFLSAFRVERARLARCKLPAWRNRVVQDYAIAASVTIAVAFGAGKTGLVVFLGQAIFAIFSFEVITYVHHYGLVRDGEADISARHAWAHHCWITNCLTFNNTFHADHHLRPRAPYYELHAMHGSPRLPASYFTMFLVALIPPLWYRLMHPRLDALALQSAKLDEGLPEWLRVQECR